MLSLALLFCVAANAPAGWSEVARSGDLVVYTRERAGSEVHELLGMGSFDAPPERVHQVLDDVASYPSFMPYVKQTKVLSSKDGVFLNYERVRAPLVSERDYTVRVTHEETTNAAGARVIHHIFRADNKDGPPPVDGVVRLEIVEGHWELEPMDGGKRTRARYFVYSSPGGSLPMFVINMANTNGVPALFEALSKRLQQLNAKVR